MTWETVSGDGKERKLGGVINFTWNTFKGHILTCKEWPGMRVDFFKSCFCMLILGGNSSEGQFWKNLQWALGPFETPSYKNMKKVGGSVLFVRYSEWNALCEAKRKLHLGKILIVFFLITQEKLTTYILLLKKENKRLNSFRWVTQECLRAQWNEMFPFYFLFWKH